jgi:hypothetical protein
MHLTFCNHLLAAKRRVRRMQLILLKHGEEKKGAGVVSEYRLNETFSGAIFAREAWVPAHKALQFVQSRGTLRRIGAYSGSVSGVF